MVHRFFLFTFIFQTNNEFSWVPFNFFNNKINQLLRIRITLSIPNYMFVCIFFIIFNIIILYI